MSIQAIPTTLVNGVRKPITQIQRSSDLNQTSILPFTSGFNASCFNGSYTDPITLTVKSGDLPGPTHQFYLRIKLVATSTAVQLAALPYWFSKLEIWRAGQEEVQKIFADEMMFHTFAHLTQSRIRDTKKFNNIVGHDQSYTDTAYISANETKYFYLPIPSTIIEHLNLDLKFLRDDISLRLYPASSPINTDGSTSYTPTVSQFDLVFHTTVLSSDSLKSQAELYKAPRSHGFLQAIPVSNGGSTVMSASTTYSWTCESVQGYVPFLLFNLRASNSNVSNGYLKNVDLGNSTTLGMVTSSGTELINNGSPARIEFYDMLNDAKFNNQAFITNQNWYVVPFCEDPTKSVLGQVNGYQLFDGSKYTLNINTCAAPVKAVSTTTLSAALASGGSFKLAWGGSVSDDLAYNASTSAIATAFAALPSAKNHVNGPITVTASATMAAGTSVTFTFSNPSGHVEINEPVQVIINCDSTLALKTATSAMTTYWQSGFTAGTYYMNLYAYVHADMVINKGNIQRIIKKPQ